MTPVPERFTAGAFAARRIAADDLPFVQTLMARPELSAHKALPHPSPPEDIARNHGADLAHWATQDFGRYVVIDADPNGLCRTVSDCVGLCGLSRRDGMAGLNLSYHLLPEHWARGHATHLVRALARLAAVHLAGQGPICGLLRAAKPASARVLVKDGFTREGDLILGGAPTTRYTRQV